MCVGGEYEKESGIKKLFGSMYSAHLLCCPVASMRFLLPGAVTPPIRTPACPGFPSGKIESS